MSIKQSFTIEINKEADSTKKMLERVPAEQFDWKPHEKSMTLKALATHVAHLESWPALVITTDELDFQNNTLERPKINTTQDLVDLSEKGRYESLQALENMDVEKMKDIWTLRNGEQILIELPKIGVLRGMCLNHLVHHRGQLSVYLRLLNVPVPGMYGPSADEH